MKLFMIGLGWIVSGSLVSAAIVAVDADGKEWNFQQPGRVLVVIGNNADTAQQARDCGKALDEFQGRKDFRSVVIVDLRGSMAQLAKGYVIHRMKGDLDEEAKRITSFYRKKGNKNNPRKEIGAIPDFDGKILRQLQWPPDQKALRVVIFDKNGKEAIRFNPANDFKAIRQKVFELLKQN